MKLFPIIFFLSITSILAQTTTLTVTETAEYKDKIKNADDILSMHTTNSNLTGIIRKSKKHLLFDVFNTSFNKVYSKVVDIGKKEVYVGDLYYNDEIKLFTVYSPNRKEREVYCHILNINSKKYEKVRLFTANVEKNQPLFSGSNKRQTNFALSPNGNYLAIATDNIKKNSNSYTVRVFNAEDLNLINKQLYQKHKEKFFEFNDLIVDNDGVIYSLGKLFNEGRSEKRGGNPNYYFVLNKINNEETKTLKIHLDDKHIASLVLAENNNGLSVLGFYSEKNTGRIKGSCNFIIDTKSLSVTKVIDSKLPKQVYEDLYSYRKAKRKKKKGVELSNFYVDYVIESKDGSTFLLAEEFYITQSYVSTGMNGMGGHWVTTYHYDDILILKYNANGELDWGRSIFKRDGSPSYNAFLKHNELHVILNSGKNLAEKKDGRTKASKGWFESSALYDFVYNVNGDVSYNKIQNNKGNTFYLPYFGNYYNNKFIMTSSGRKKKQFMVLE